MDTHPFLLSAQCSKEFTKIVRVGVRLDCVVVLASG